MADNPFAKYADPQTASANPFAKYAATPNQDQGDAPKEPEKKTQGNLGLIDSIMHPTQSALYKTLSGDAPPIDLSAENIGKSARKAGIKAAQQTWPMLAGEGAVKALSPVLQKIGQSGAVQRMMANRPSLQEMAKPAGEMGSKELKAYSGTQYDQIPHGTTRYKPDYMQSVKKDLLPETPVSAADKIDYANNPAVKFVSKWDPVFQEHMSIKDFEKVDQDLSQEINQHFKTGLDKDGRKLYDLQTKLRERILNPANEAIEGGAEDVKTYRRALKSYSDAKRLEDIENIFRTSTTATDKAASLRNGFKRLYNSPKRLRGYSEKQIKLIKQASESDMTTEQLKNFASKFISKVAIATGHPIAGVTSSILSNSIKNADQALAAKKMQPLINSITDPYKNPMSNITKGASSGQ
jgi:hypothetical protein